jgi:hypothetical protein
VLTTPRARTAYACVHVVQTHTRPYPLVIDRAAVPDATAAVSWLVRAHRRIARPLGAAAAVVVHASARDVTAEATAALEAGHGYGIQVCAVDSIAVPSEKTHRRVELRDLSAMHTMRLRRSQAETEHQEAAA